MWSPKAELVKHAVSIAKEKHPTGFNKSQLIEASSEVFGGYGEAYASNSPLVSPPRTMEEVNNAGNAMAQIDGGYPVGMSTCMIVGINGGCGLECPAYLGGDCDEPQEFDIDDMDEAEQANHLELYGDL